MTATFPGGVKSFTSKSDGVDKIYASHVNDLQDEVAAVETELRKSSGSVVDHNALTNFVANKHIDHSVVSISAGTGLTGGGTLEATRTLSLSFLGLQSLTDPNADRVLFWDDSAGAFKWLTLGTGLTITDTTIAPTQPQFYPLTTPLTSTSWDGDSFSSSGPTVIDTSVVFGAPAGIKAAAVRLTARDSVTFGTGGLYLSLGPSTSYYYAVSCYPFGGDINNTASGIVPCDASGDFYYKIIASGSGTLDAWIEIWGYWL